MPSSPSTDDLIAQILASLRSGPTPLPRPTAAFIRALVPLTRPRPPLASLAATARIRILAADLTSRTVFDAAWAAQSDFAAAAAPTAPDVAITTKEARLRCDVVVQVRDIEDLSRSRWDAVEELEAIERGETRRGREVVRLVSESGNGDSADGDGDGDQTQTTTTTTTAAAAAGATTARQQQLPNQPASTSAGATSTHRLTLQDPSGVALSAFELVRNRDRIGTGVTHIGEKIVLRTGTVVARGTILLVPELCVFLGGRIDGWHRAWAAGRLERLKEAARTVAP